MLRSFSTGELVARLLKFARRFLGRQRAVFVDCGAYDGCSVIKARHIFGRLDYISFEPNPELWKYFNELPTLLIKRAVWVHDGRVELIIDPFDADGSSVVESKQIDFFARIPNSACPRLLVDCVDLSAFIRELSHRYSKIILKLDVEGAEYPILGKMIRDRTLAHVQELFVEFHWQKMGVSKGTHEEFVSRVQSVVPISHWDAQEYAIHMRDHAHVLARRDILQRLL